LQKKKLWDIKQTEIVNKAKSSFQKQGRQPQLFMAIVQLAIVALQILIYQILKTVYRENDHTERGLPHSITSGETGNMQIIDDKKVSETE